jgi:hypothetical protein
MVLVDAALHLVYELYRCHYAHRHLARLGSSQIMVPTWVGQCRAPPIVRTNGLDRHTPRGVVSAPITGRNSSDSPVVSQFGLWRLAPAKLPCGRRKLPRLSHGESFQNIPLHSRRPEAVRH